ncbi:MAG: hypothetical protein R3F11_31360 [Verrucomicrobiales bacterium]
MRNEGEILGCAIEDGRLFVEKEETEVIEVQSGVRQIGDLRDGIEIEEFDEDPVSALIYFGDPDKLEAEVKGVHEY